MYKGGLVSKSSKGSYYDKFRGRIIFPIFDVKGKIIAFGGRIIEAQEQAPKYLNSPETIVFNKSKTLYGLNIARKHIRHDSKLILVEGYMDVIMLHKYGVKNAVATLGTSFTKEHSRVIRKYVDELIICFDSDEAGQKATKRAIENTKGIIEKVRVIQLEEGYDPDDFISEKGYEAFLHEINEAKASHMFLLDEVSKGLNLEEEYDLRDFIIKSREILEDITDYARQHYYCNIISERLDMPLERIMKEIFPENSDNQRKIYPSRKKAKKENSINTDSHLATIEKKLLQFALMDQEYFYLIKQSIDLENFNFKSVFNIFQFLEDYYQQADEFVLENALDYLNIEEGKLCKQLIRENKEGKHDLRDIEIYIKKFEIERLQEELKQLKYSRESTFSAKEKEAIIVKEEIVKREIINKKSRLGN
jgi:DNA primase